MCWIFQYQIWDWLELVSKWWCHFVSQAYLAKGRVIAQAVSRRLPIARRPGFEPRSDHPGFVADKVALR
jgi:hypothetical protein